ncbi:hypothetical protein EUTSA_v10028918mg [Eutrema salsugineum]|uniref:Uncharacterized protein n=1 Tax=Eutrema salsugineum TaxID=72664 RepID=V4MYX7_EUTSA|nr:uncharacterized protein LOC18015246 [Eutrema salsugineum]ESQ37816.1 hypothetical protein EUTSA_v10028918mg [Eutrema salsugineum]
MACDEDMKMASFLREEEEQHYSLSRLSVCSNYDGDEADGEPSDSEDKIIGGGEKSMEHLEFSDSDDKGSTGCQSLPATPPRRRRRRGTSVNSPVSGDKAYASENEAQKAKQGNNNQRRRMKLRPEYPPWVDSMRRSYGEEQSGYGGGVVVVTRPIGGGRPLCMDLGEVKACKDLGFELEPGRVSYSGSTMDTSSGGNSPISSNHRISSPGDDPKEVKARLKAWAHAVAFVSTTHHHQPPNSL